MAGPFNDRSPADFDEMIGQLTEFRDTYVQWVGHGSGSGVERGPERSRVRELAVVAADAVNATGQQVAVTPPRNAPGAYPLVGLVAVAFAHEDPTFHNEPTMGPGGVFYASNRPDSMDITIDVVENAVAILKRRKELEQRRRRRLTYWPDRVLRAILGFPAYLISLFLGFDRRDLSSGQAQLLWVVSVIADVAGIAGAGVAFDWWG